MPLYRRSSRASRARSADGDAKPRNLNYWSGHGFAERALPDLAVFYEHPQWFEPLFAELDRRGVDWTAIPIQDHTFDPADDRVPAPVILNRLAMSSFLRQSEHALFYSLAALDHWQGLGARVINGPGVLAYDLSKARQLSLFRRCGLEIPRTRVAHRRADVPRLAAEIGYPVMVKVNVGGSGAGMIRYDSAEELERGRRRRPDAGRRRWRRLVQEYVPARDARVIRCEVLDGRAALRHRARRRGLDLRSLPRRRLHGRQADHHHRGLRAAGRDRRRRSERIADAARHGRRRHRVHDRRPRRHGRSSTTSTRFPTSSPTRCEVLGCDPHEPFVSWLIGQIAAAAQKVAA